MLICGVIAKKGSDNWTTVCTCSFLILTLACTWLHLQLPDACLNLSRSLLLSPHHSPHLLHSLLTCLILYTTLLHLDEAYNQLLEASGNQAPASETVLEVYSTLVPPSTPTCPRL